MADADERVGPCCREMMWSVGVVTEKISEIM